MTPNELKDAIVKCLLEKKADDITVLHVTEQTTVTDYFVIATGKSTTQVKALMEYLEEKLEEQDIFVTRKEGEREARWVVMDYASVIVHIFNDQMRDLYALEKLWGKGSNVEKITDVNV